MEELEKMVEEKFQKSKDWNGWGMSKLVLDILHQTREDVDRAAAAAERARKWSMLFCLLALVACLLTGAFLGVLAAGVQVDTTTTTTTETVTQDTGEGSGNNIYQAGEYASYSQGGGV